MKLIKYTSIGLFLIFLFFCSWFALKGDLMFHTDMARDFLLFDELVNKKVVLIGPRSDWPGLFHGPLWLYLNLPAYLAGHGNPVFVAWYWIFLLLIFSALFFFLIKKLFDGKTAYYFLPLFASLMVPYTSNFYNPAGAMFLSIPYFFTLSFYHKTKKPVFMAANLLLAGISFQFLLAVGAPLIVLSLVYFTVQILIKKYYRLFLWFLILAIPLSTFLLFDLRHGFIQTRAVIDHFTGGQSHLSIGWPEKLKNRVETMFINGLGFASGSYSFMNIIFGYVTAVAVVLVLRAKNDRFRIPFFIFIFIYIGFYLLSLLDSGMILQHYFLAFMPLTLLVFAASHRILGVKIFSFFFTLLVAVSLTASVGFVKSSNSYIGKDKGSWTGLLSVAKKTYLMAKTDNFGVYLYAPDMYGYAQKYAFQYGQTLFPGKKMNFSRKMTETFLVYEPAPKDRPDLNGSGWKAGLVKINRSPVETVQFPNGFRLERYILDDNEIKIQSDSLLNDWVSQR